PGSPDPLHFHSLPTRRSSDLELEDPIDPAVDPEGARAQAEQPLVVYPTAHKIRNNFIADAVKTVLGPMQPGDIPDPIPESVRERSEEHTSELQSRFDLVCRLL